MKTIGRLALAVALGVMGFAAPAAADTIHVSNVALPYYETLAVAGFSTGGAHNYTFASDSSVLAGQIVLTTNIGNLGTWCVDLFHTVNLGAANITYNTVDLMTNNSGPGPLSSNSLTTTQVQQIESLAAYGNLSLPTASNKNQFAALIQAAIWQVEYFGVSAAHGITSGSDAAFDGLLTTLLNTTLPGLPAGGGVQLESVTGDPAVFTVQNLELPVPEPGTLALVGSLLVALGLLRGRLRGSRTSSI